MSAKKRKGISPWSACEDCHVIISQRDAVVHKEKCCPPDFNNWSHPFIHLEKLYSSFDIFQLEDKNLNLIPKEERNDIVIIPYHVLQLCKIPVGDPVSVKVAEFDRTAHIIKTAWSALEKTSSFNIFFSAEVAELYNLKLGSQVIISAINEKISPADSVTVDCESEISYLDTRNLLMRLQGQYKNKIINVGSKLLIRNYGSKIVFNVVKLVLSRECEVNNDSFSLVTEKTKWQLCDISDVKQKGRDSIKKLGGLDSTIAELQEIISLTFSKGNFSSGDVFGSYNFYLCTCTCIKGICFTRGVLIYGPPGTGKTTLIEALAEEFTSSVVRIECTKIFSKFLGETEKELQSLFEKAELMSPSIILIDDLDVLCAKSNSPTEFEKRTVATLCSRMDKLNRRDSPVMVLGTTSKIHQIDKMLRCPSRFGKEVEIHVPGVAERFEILKVLLADVNHNLNDFNVQTLADSLHGFVGADLVSLVSKAALQNYKTSQGREKVSGEHFLWASKKVKPSAMKEVMLDIPNVRWEDVGGQEELKLKLRQCVEWPLKYREAFSKLGLTAPKGVLMFGPPGCSKTMIAKALATESQLNFISVKGPELFSKWVGESEGAVRKVFKRARETAPSIIFFDELDAIGGERNISGNSNVQERVLAQLLTELDGVESLDNVTVIAATNRLDRIDPALMRPGRLDRIIYVPLPDGKTRQDIFRLQLKKTPISEDVNVDELVEKTEGYSAAEIVAVSREAALKALEEDLNAKTVKRKHFMHAFNIVLPRTPKSLLELYDKYLLK